MADMHTRDTIVKAIEAFLQRTGMTERQFGVEVANDHKFVRRLREGRGTTLTVIERAERYMADWKPEQAATPSEAAE